MIRVVNGHKYLLLRLVLLLPLLTYSHDSLPQSPPQPALSTIVGMFKNHPIVAIGEGHSLQEAGDFYDSLIEDRSFQETVNDIVVEFASRQSQPILDRYVNGEDVAPETLNHVWRDTTKAFAWESPIYRRLLAKVRAANASLPRDKRLRVLAGDTWIDWSTVTSHQEWSSLQPNDQSFAEVIVREVLQKQHKALVILGSAHLSRNTDPSGMPNTTALIERAYPGAIYVVLFSSQPPADHTQVMAPVIFDWPKVIFPDGRKRIVGEHGDSALFLGSRLRPADPEWADYPKDTAYLNELDRRSRIRWGCAFNLSRIKAGIPVCSSR